MLISDNQLYIILVYLVFVKYGFTFVILLKYIWCYKREGSIKKLTDGALIHSDHEDVRIPAGGSKQIASYDTVENRQHYY